MNLSKHLKQSPFLRHGQFIVHITSHSEPKTIYQVSNHRSAILPEALACRYLAQNMRKDVPGSDWKGKWRFPLDVRSGFGWIIPPLLIVFKARPALMAWRGARARVGWWLPAHGEAFSYFPPCATAAKVSGRSKGSGGVMGNAWLTEMKWSRRWRVSVF